MPTHSPLHDEHVALGGHLVDFAGWLLPLRYTSDLAEHRAVRSAAGIFDLSHMGEIRVTGADAGAFLDYALVSQLSTVAVGKAKYTMICQTDGAVLDDLIVYRLGETEYLIVANAANVEVVVTSLREAAAGFDVTLTDESASAALIAVQGPAAVDIVAGLSQPSDEVRGLGYYGCVSATYAGVPALIARTGYTGEDGFEMFVAAENGPQVWRETLAAGQDAGLIPAGLAARDSLRIEAGMPLYGHELNAHTTPYAAGLGRIVALKKTDASGNPLPFIGREALAARAQSAPARLLVGLKGLGRRAARAGYSVLIGTSPEKAHVIGQVTSGLPSPTLGYPIAMAYVTPEFSGVGTVVGVDIRGNAEPFEVVPLPFYRRPQ